MNILKAAIHSLLHASRAAFSIACVASAACTAVLAAGLFSLSAPAAAAQASAPTAAAAPSTGLSAKAQALLAPLAAKRVEGKFEESRTVPGFPKPMVTQGVFTLEGERLVWEAQKPFPSLMTVNPEGVFIEAAGEKQALTAAEIPAVGRICTLLTSVMGGRFDALAELFDVKVTPEAGKVFIQAQPKSPELAQAMKLIEAEAGAHLEKLVMTGPQGDIATIRFTEVKVER